MRDSTRLPPALPSLRAARWEDARAEVEQQQLDRGDDLGIGGLKE